MLLSSIENTDQQKEIKMAKLKKPENESEEESRIRKAKERVANSANRSEKTAWDRKMDNMVKLLGKLDPIEQQISDLMALKIPIMDDIQILRMDMVKSCTHPITHLTFHDNYIKCKFCNSKFNTITT